MPTAPGHVFYDRLNGALGAAGFDREVEALCAPHYAARAGRSSMARVALLLRAVLCERAFTHLLDRSGMRRT